MSNDFSSETEIEADSRWVASYLKLEGNKALVDIPRDYLSDKFKGIFNWSEKWEDVIRTNGKYMTG